MEMNGILIGVKLLERFSNSQRQKIKNSFTFRAHALYVDGGYVSVNQISKTDGKKSRNSKLPLACLLQGKQYRRSALHQHHFYIINGF